MPQTTPLPLQQPVSYHSNGIQKPWLEFQTNAPFHNISLQSVKQLSNQDYIIQPQPDPSKSGSKLWFHFLVTCNETNIYTLRIDGISKKKLSWNGCFIKKIGDTKWKRVQGSSSILQSIRTQYSSSTFIEITVKFTKDSQYEIAYFPPYTYSYLRTRLKRWHKTFPDRCKVEKITNSYEGRALNLVTISPPDQILKPTVCIIGRIHPGEVPSSWIIDGLLEYIIESDSPEAIRLREKVCFRIVPMLNPDGCERGHYRCNALGHDLNRFWLNPSEKYHPEIFFVKKLLLTWKQNEKYSLDFFIDVHAHSSGVSSFMYYNNVIGSKRKDELLRLPKILSQRSNGQFSFKLCKMDNSEKKIGCSRRALGDFLQIAPFSFTLESSFSGYFPNGNKKLEMVHFHAQNLKFLGKHIIDSLDEFYQSWSSDSRYEKITSNSSWNGSQRTYLWNEFITSSQLENNKKNESVDQSTIHLIQNSSVINSTSQIPNQNIQMHSRRLSMRDSTQITTQNTKDSTQIFRESTQISRLAKLSKSESISRPIQLKQVKELKKFIS